MPHAYSSYQDDPEGISPYTRAVDSPLFPACNHNSSPEHEEYYGSSPRFYAGTGTEMLTNLPDPHLATNWSYHGTHHNVDLPQHSFHQNCHQHLYEEHYQQRFSFYPMVEGNHGYYPETNGQSSMEHGFYFNEHSGKPKRKRVASIAQRRAANIRERRRMFNLNEAFDILRKKVPTFAYEKRLSRIETLRLAITYISFMAQLVDGKTPKDTTLHAAATDSVVTVNSAGSPAERKGTTRADRSLECVYSDLEDSGDCLSPDSSSQL